MDRVSLIYKVLSGEASAAEQKELDEWVGRTPGNKEEFEDIKLLWTTAKRADGESLSLSEVGFEKIKARMRADARRRRWFKAGGKTAVILILGLAAFIVLHNLTGRAPAQRFEFEDVTLEEAISVIEDRYNIRIETEDPELLQRHVTLVVYEVKDGQGIVGGLAQSLNLDVTLLSPKRYRLSEARE